MKQSFSNNPWQTQDYTENNTLFHYVIQSHQYSVFEDVSSLSNWFNW